MVKNNNLSGIKMYIKIPITKYVTSSDSKNMYVTFSKKDMLHEFDKMTESQKLDMLFISRGWSKVRANSQKGLKQNAKR